VLEVIISSNLRSNILCTGFGPHCSRLIKRRQGSLASPPIRAGSLIIRVWAAETTRSRHRDFATSEVVCSEQKSYTWRISSEAWWSIADVMKQEGMTVEKSFPNKSTMMLVKTHKYEGDGSLITSWVSTGH